MNVRTGDGRIHTVSFGELPASADVDASRFCAKHGVLDDECSKLASSMKSVQAKNRGDQWGMSISSPPEGAQVRVPGDLDVVLEFFFLSNKNHIQLYLPVPFPFVHIILL